MTKLGVEHTCFWKAITRRHLVLEIWR